MLAVLICALVSAPAFGQGGVTSSITGIVVDQDGGVVPGATVVATNESTGGTYTVTSAANGTFIIPSILPGTYTVTVTLQGFKQSINKGIAVTAGEPGNVRARLELGGVTETVVVEGATQMVQTQTSVASSTINTNQIQNLPLGSRSTLDFVPLLPGVMTPGGSRDSIVNGLPQSSINITLDGVSIQDNHLKTGDGFFARVSPRLDAVEEISVITAGQSADASGQGSTQIRFTTRSGSNTYSGSAYYYFQHEKLNTNTYFNKLLGLPIEQGKQHNPGNRVGGPVVLPGLYDGRGKMFFFTNYEINYTPRTSTFDREILLEDTQRGVFRYATDNNEIRSVNVLTLAAQTGNISTVDPIIGNLLQTIRNSTVGTGVFRPFPEDAQELNSQEFVFQQSTKGNTKYPTIRLDYNLSSAHRLSGSYNFTDLLSTPDTLNGREPRWPGFPGWDEQDSHRYAFQTSLRSSLTGTMVNEVRYGMSGGRTLFAPRTNASRAAFWNDPIVNQGGFHLSITPAFTDNAVASANISAREASTKFIENQLTWLKGSHSLVAGGTFTKADVWLLSATAVPTLNFGTIASGSNADPASGMFTSANFPGSSSGERNSAAALYGVLTGRVTSITGTGRLNPATGKYVYNGDSLQRGALRQLDFFIQDGWRARPNLTVNLGFRYALQLPFYSKDNSYSTATLDDVWGISGFAQGCNPSEATPETCNLFKQGFTPGIIPTFQNLGGGVKAYNTDMNNWAPSVGVNWTPTVEGGFLRKILGQQGDTSFQAGWSRAYERHGMSDFTGVLGSNPGITTPATRNNNNGNLGATPLLFRSGDLGPPAVCAPGVSASNCMVESPIYPIQTTGTGSINIFDPDLRVPYSDSWNIGFQRAVGRRAAFEFRYIGTRNREQWTTYNYNEFNILENGFLDEWKLAQHNLYANIAAGRFRGSGDDREPTFQYFGEGSNTFPLPIMLAYISGRTDAGNAGAYTSNSFTSTTFVNPLSRFEGNPLGFASSLNGDAGRRNNAISAGLPRNFFVANPDALGGANVTGYGGFTRFNGIQMQFRRRLSNGLQWDVNYATGLAKQAVRYSFRVPRLLSRDTGAEGDVAHAVKGTFVYEIPFGQGRRFGTNIGPWMDRLIGGWQVAGTARLQTGRLFDLGNINIVGMSEDEARKAFKFRRVSASEMYMWPDDIIENTIKAFDLDINGFTQGEPTGRYFAPRGLDGCVETINNSYGDCGLRTFIIQGPLVRFFDLSFSKEIRLQGRQNLQIRVDALNVLDHTNFAPVTGIGGDNRSDFIIDNDLSSGRTVQIVARFNW
jgi:hypothetical protein